MRTSARGMRLIVEHEGFRESAYIPVPGDVPTIGFGFTKGVKLGDTMTLAEAKARLKVEVAEHERGVASALVVAPTQAQFDACVSLAYNIGVAAFRRSSVAKAHNRGDFQAAARAFALWNKSNGRVYAGLVRRRAAEAALYLSDQDESPMPQTVAPEKPMTDSTINRASVAAGGTAAIVAASEALQVANEVKNGVESLGSWLVPMLLVVVVALCGYIIWERCQQRKRGDA